MVEEDEDSPTWDDLNETIKTIKCKGKYGWMRVLQAVEKESGKQFISLKKFRQRFNLKSPAQVNDALNAILKISDEMDWEVELEEEEIGELESITEKYEQLKIKSKTQKEKYETSINKLMKKFGELRDQQLTNNIPAFEKDLKDFKKNLAHKSEKEIQIWLKDRPWFFGPKYLEQKVEVLCDTDGRLDFFLKRYDTFYDIVELKLPKDELFKLSKKEKQKRSEDTDLILNFSREVTISRDLKSAIMQVIGYLETYEESKASIYTRKGKLIHKPKGFVIIGDFSNLSAKERRDSEKLVKTLNSYLRSVEVMTYDQLYDTAQNFVALIKNRKKNKLK